MRTLFIVGCSGHGKVAADIAVKSGKYDQINFLDDNPQIARCMQFPVVGRSDYEEIFSQDDIFVAIGNSAIREKLMKRYIARGLKIANLIHPDAVIGMNVKMGIGTIIMAGTVINPDTVLGNGVIVNTGATVDHDNQIAEYAHISVGSHLAGTVTIGRHTWVGAGTVVSNNISICDDVTIGAGAVIIRDIKECGTYAGIPARKIK